MRGILRITWFTLLSLALACGAAGCGLWELFADAPAGAPLPQNAILVVFQNQSGLPIQLDATFVDSEQDVRRTSRRLAASGVEAEVSLIRTTAERISVVAAIHADATTSQSDSPLLRPGVVLLDREFVLYVDYEPGGTLEVAIPAPPADCDANGVPDADEIAAGDRDDCDGNGVPDVCETDSDGDGLIDVCDNCPNIANSDQADADSDGIGDVCDTQACCYSENACVDLLIAECVASDGVPLGDGTSCDTSLCSDRIELHAGAERDWIYEALAEVSQCDIGFYVEIGNDPYGNETYDIEWSVSAPFDRPYALFAVADGAGTATPVYTPPARPAFSPTGVAYIVTVTVTGNQYGNQGTKSFAIDVRLLADVNNDGCTDETDRMLIRDVEDGVITDPEIIAAADVNCDGLVDALDSQIALAVEQNFDGNGVCVDEQPNYANHGPI